MNAVGRIFIVLIFIMSLIFMSFTVAVYSVSNNWKATADKLKGDLTKAQSDRSRLENEKKELEKNCDELLTAKGNEIAGLHAQLLQFQTDNTMQQEDLVRLQNAINIATQTIKTTHESLQVAQAEQTTLRNEFRKTQLDWNDLLTDFIKKTDEAHDLSMKLGNLESVSQELVKQYANAKAVLDLVGMKPVPELYTGIPPYLVTGRVTEVRPTGLVEVTIGEDSGLMKGHQLDVYRKSDDGRDIYLGVVEVLLTEPNRAAARIMPEYRKGTVQAGDIVTSEFSQERQRYQLNRDTHVATTINQ